MNKNELALLLSKEKYKKELYSLEGNVLLEGHCLDLKEGKWRTYYFERGSEFEVELFESEDEACARLYEKIKKDPFMK